ncbi:hypothetical protein NL676_039061 [Syzygium grande]|nr:hypothetical protein NL676_039061 [Syzygium grande]
MVKLEMHITLWNLCIGFFLFCIHWVWHVSKSFRCEVLAAIRKTQILQLHEETDWANSSQSVDERPMNLSLGTMDRTRSRSVDSCFEQEVTDWANSSQAVEERQMNSMEQNSSPAGVPTLQ